MTEILWCIAAGGGTILGALILLWWKNPSDRAFDLSLSAGAGIMLAATVLGLLPGAIIDTPFWKAAVGFAVGVGVIAFADGRIPHWHARFIERRDSREEHQAFVQTTEETVQRELPPSAMSASLKTATMLAAAIALHNFPEGAAVGSSFAAGNELGVSLALAILIHNIPEGLAVALPMMALGMSMRRVIFWTGMTGVIEIVGALLAYALGTQIDGLLPFGLAFAAGAMLYVIVDEMIPAAHSRGEQTASLLFLGFFGAMACMMAALGSIPF